MRFFYICAIALAITISNISHAADIKKINLNNATVSKQATNTSTKTTSNNKAKGKDGKEDKADCKLVTINEAARKSLEEKNIKVIEALFDDPEFQNGLASAGNAASSCVTELKDIWSSIAGDYKIGDNVGGLLDALKDFDVNALVSGIGEKALGAAADVANSALEKVCQEARSKIKELFGSVSDIFSTKLDFGDLGSFSPEAIMDAEGITFDIDYTSGGSNSISNFLDNVWK